MHESNLKRVQLRKLSTEDVDRVVGGMRQKDMLISNITTPSGNVYSDWSDSSATDRIEDH